MKQAYTSSDFLTPNDLISILPFCRNKIYSLLKNRNIKSKKCGRQYLVQYKDLCEYINNTGGEQDGIDDI